MEQIDLGKTVYILEKLLKNSVLSPEIKLEISLLLNICKSSRFYELIELQNSLQKYLENYVKNKKISDHIEYSNHYLNGHNHGNRPTSTDLSLKLSDITSCSHNGSLNNTLNHDDSFLPEYISAFKQKYLLYAHPSASSISNIIRNAENINFDENRGENDYLRNGGDQLSVAASELTLSNKKVLCDQIVEDYENYVSSLQNPISPPKNISNYRTETHVSAPIFCGSNATLSCTNDEKVTNELLNSNIIHQKVPQITNINNNKNYDNFENKSHDNPYVINSSSPTDKTNRYISDYKYELNGYENTKPNENGNAKTNSNMGKAFVKNPSNNFSEPVVVGWEYHCITLKKTEGKSLGFSITGGRDNPTILKLDSSSVSFFSNNGDKNVLTNLDNSPINHTQTVEIDVGPAIIVTKLIAGGMALNDGRLRINDIIARVNHDDLTDVDHDEAVETLKKAGKCVNLLVKRPILICPNQSVVCLKKGKTGLGFSISGGYDNEQYCGDPSIFIAKIIPGGEADLNGRVHVGDKIIKVNEHVLDCVSHDDAVTILKALPQDSLVNMLIMSPENINSLNSKNGSNEIKLQNNQPNIIASDKNGQLNDNNKFNVDAEMEKTDIIDLIQNTCNNVIGADTNRNFDGNYINHKDMSLSPQNNHQPPLTVKTHGLQLISSMSTAKKQKHRSPLINELRQKLNITEGDNISDTPTESKTININNNNNSTLNPNMNNIVCPTSPTAILDISPKLLRKLEKRFDKNDIQRVVLHRETNGTGLGFNIVGGEPVFNPNNSKQSVSGYWGIFIAHVTPGSPAHLSQKLQVGDLILAVNENDLTQCDHKSAVQYLKNAGNIVTLYITHKPNEYQEYEFQMKQLECSGYPSNTNKTSYLNATPKDDINEGLQNISINNYNNVTQDCILSKGDPIIEKMSITEAKNGHIAIQPTPTLSQSKPKASSSSISTTMSNETISHNTNSLNKNDKCHQNSIMSGSLRIAPQKRSLYVKALFDYDAERDRSDLPGPGLTFFAGNLIHVSNASDEHWWRARRLLAGLDYFPYDTLHAFNKPVFNASATENYMNDEIDNRMHGTLTTPSTIGLIPSLNRVRRKEKYRNKSVKFKGQSPPKRVTSHSTQGINNIHELLDNSYEDNRFQNANKHDNNETNSYTTKKFQNTIHDNNSDKREIDNNIPITNGHKSGKYIKKKISLNAISASTHHLNSLLFGGGGKTSVDNNGKKKFSFTKNRDYILNNDTDVNDKSFINDTSLRNEYTNGCEMVDGSEKQASNTVSDSEQSLNKLTDSLPCSQNGGYFGKASLNDISSLGTNNSFTMPYQPVHLVPIDYKRPIIILGPFKDRISDQLIQDFPETFSNCVPHTTRAPRPGEVDGQDYHFVAGGITHMECLIKQGLFIEAGQFNGNLYGTSLEAVRDVAFIQEKHCLLDVSGNAIRRLVANDIFPIVIGIRPLSHESLMELDQEMDEMEAQHTLEKAEKCLIEFEQYFNCVIPADTHAQMYRDVCECISKNSELKIWQESREPL